MSYLLVIAHGSRREASNAEVADLVSQLNQVPGLFSRIDYAFLEIAEPSIPQALEQLIADGAKRIIVMPYILSAGRHVAIDIPEQVTRVMQAHPNIELHIADHLGASPVVRQLLLDMACEAMHSKCRGDSLAIG